VRGVAVTLVDRGEIAGGTTGLGEGNVLASDKDAGPELDLTIAGLRVYDDIDARLGAEAQVRRKGALIVHPDAATWAGEAARVERLRAAGVAASLLSSDEVREREPLLEGPVHGASFFPGDLQSPPPAGEAGQVGPAEEAGQRRVRPGQQQLEIGELDRAGRIGRGVPQQLVRQHPALAHARHDASPSSSRLSRCCASRRRCR